MRSANQGKFVICALIGFGVGVAAAALLRHDRKRRGRRSLLARASDAANRVTDGAGERRAARDERRLMQQVERFRTSGL